MSTAYDRGWGDPTKGDYAAAHSVPVTAGGVTIRVHASVAPIFEFVLTELAKHYNLAKTADDYGGIVRPIRGREQQWAATHDFRYLSNHSWYLAADLDSGLNPMTTDPSAHHEFVAAVCDPILAVFRGRLVWGGEYVGERKDYMHWEYIGTPQQAAADSLLAQAALLHTTLKEMSMTDKDYWKKLEGLLIRQAQFLAGRENSVFNAKTVGVPAPKPNKEP